MTRLRSRSQHRGSNRGVAVYEGSTCVASCELLEARTMLNGQTALDTYVAAPDPTFSFFHHSTVSGVDSTGYVLSMNSQTWRTPAEVNNTVWHHWVTVIVPNNVASSTGVLFIDGGSNPGSPPGSVDFEMELLAIATQSPVVQLKTVPNQPLVFSDEGFPRTEDAILAYTFDKFLTTGDDTWPALLPMVKSAVRAMDAAQQFLPTVTGGSLSINDYVVGGGSKRGWTTWLTAAVDPRVTAIVPVVFDALNLDEQLTHHVAHYEGVTQLINEGYSWVLNDYTALDIPDAIGTPEGQALLDIIDPYSYLDRLDMPKYLLNASGDEFFVPDSSQFYFDDLLGTNYLRYVPNAGHGVTDNYIDAIGGVVPFYDTVVFGGTLPQFSWTLEDSGQTIRVTTVDTPLSVTMWEATNPVNRDFRWLDGSGPQWTSTALADQGGGVYVANVTPPASGATAFMVEVRFDSTGLFDYAFSTEISVVNPVTTPTAEAGGPYAGVEGVPVALTGGGSGTISTYEWDLDNNGSYETPGQVVNFDPGDDGAYTVGLRVTGPGGSDTDTATVNVSNVAPTAAIAGTTDIFRGETVTFTLTAADASPVDQAASFTFEIDWDGDSLVDETVVGPSGSTVGHRFTDVTSSNIQVRATDKDGGTGAFDVTPYTVNPFVLRPDGGGNTDLIYGGTDLLDGVFFFGTQSNFVVFTQFEGFTLANRFDSLGAAVTGKAILHGFGSDDVLAAEFLQGVPVEIHGGGGNDVIVGGRLGDMLFGDAGHDLVVGGDSITDGDDTIFGGSGNDVLFGYLGADQLFGEAGEDLLIGDRFTFTNLSQGMLRIHQEWISGKPYATRVSNILFGGGLNNPYTLTPGVTLFDDGATDTLTGGLGDLDWFFYAFGQDLAADVEGGETESDSAP